MRSTSVTVFKTFYPGEMVIIALLLAFIPYLLLRGLFARIARHWVARRLSPPQLEDYEIAS